MENRHQPRFPSIKYIKMRWRPGLWLDPAKELTSLTMLLTGFWGRAIWTEKMGKMEGRDEKKGMAPDCFGKN